MKSQCARKQSEQTCCPGHCQEAVISSMEFLNQILPLQQTPPDSTTALQFAVLRF